VTKFLPVLATITPFGIKPRQADPTEVEVVLPFVYSRGMKRHLLAVLALLPLIACNLINPRTAPLTDSSTVLTSKRPTLHYTDSGKGRTLLFLHGFGANSYSWSKVSPSLLQNYRVILLDLKGHGASPKPKDGAYSLHDQADLVADFIADRALEDIALIGHSMGGGIALLVALKLAAKLPSPISSLILVDSVAYSQPLPGFVKILRTPLLGPLSVWLVPDRIQTLHVLKLAYYDSDKITEETIEAYSSPLSLPGARCAMIESARQIIPSNIEEIGRRYETISVPTLLVWGKHDEIVPLELGERLYRSIPNSDLVVIDEAGHVPQEEAPAATLQAIQEFLRAKP
jgi:pimeloyl-ACP methyl ester carboxylesterase